MLCFLIGLILALFRRNMRSIWVWLNLIGLIAYASFILDAISHPSMSPERQQYFRMSQYHLRLRAEQGDQYSDGNLAQLQQNANSGVYYAQYQLGIIYERGQAVPKDYVQAYKWIYLAASRTTEKEEDRDPPASKRIYMAELNRLAEKMSPEQISEAKSRASEWRPREF
jgi:hypothetical protein